MQDKHAMCRAKQRASKKTIISQLKFHFVYGTLKMKWFKYMATTVYTVARLRFIIIRFFVFFWPEEDDGEEA